MKKIAILLAATMAFAINSNTQSMQSGYKGHVEAGYSVGIGDYVTLGVLKSTQHMAIK